MKVYIVEGRTGEYSDHVTWNVCAYMSKASAVAKVERLTQNIGEATVRWGEERVKYARHFNPEDKELLEFIGDPYFQSDYTGTTYHLSEVDVVDLGWPETHSTQ